jgi:fermentation-respiration switch protein FrsA (DUF1100 family)
MTMREIAFDSAGTSCAAWHLPASTDELRDPSGAPCVVMAHGFGGTRDTGILPFAEGFAAAGLDVLLFDYRGFGASGGTPRQLVSFRRQRADYQAAVAAARRLPGIDPDRIVVWGTSYSGGHVLHVAAGDPRVAAVIAMTPAPDGLAALLAIVKREGIGAVLRLTAAGLRDLGGAVVGRAPHTIALAGAPGSLAIMADPVAATAYPAIGGPTWRNEVCARSALEVALNRPVRSAGRVRSPLLVQIGTNDTIAPPAAAEKVAALAGPRAEVQHFPFNHFDVYGGPAQTTALNGQLDFLRRHLALGTARRAAAVS